MANVSKPALQRLKEQRAIIDARIQATEFRLKQTHRKQDTRRKILVGSYYLDKAVTEKKMDELKKIMDVFLTRDSDRKLFDLHSMPNKEKTDV
jgi:large subunit ribosomal protein L7/L12